MSVPGARRSVGGSNYYRGVYRDYANSHLAVGEQIVAGFPMTVMAWWFKPALTSGVIWAMGTGISLEHFRLALEGTPTNVLLWMAFDNAADSRATISPWVANQWNHAAGMEVSTTERHVFLNGAKSSDTSTEDPAPTGGTTTISDAFATGAFIGQLAWVTTWDVILTDAEVAEAAAGKHHLTIRPESMVSCVPSVGLTPEPDLAPRAAFRTWALTGGGGADDRLLLHAPPIRRYEQELILAHQYEQEGYRWRDDDGSESAATFLAAQDTDITRAKAINTRLRSVIDSTVADPPAAEHATEYRKVGDADTEWREIPL